MGDFNDPFMRNPTAGVQARAKAQNRANVMQLKLIGQSHPTGLTANLLKLFEPRPALDFKPPPEKRKCPPYTGMAQFVNQFAKPEDPEYAPPVQKAETPAQRKARIHKIKLEEGAKKAAEELEKYDPNSDHNISGDPYKTLFVARLNYETSESRLKREFEAYGPIKRVRLVTDKNTNKPRGYAFIEYVHTRDMKSAYKQADGKKIDNRRVLVDVERGRTVPNWRPRRLGGGLGTTRVGGDEGSLKISDREQSQPRGVSRSVEPRLRDERDRDREKSRERVRERERAREKSRERSQDRERDRDHLDDRHHRDREKTRDKEREKDRGRDRESRERDRGRDRTRDRERSHDRERDHDHDRHRDRHREKDRDRDRDRDRDDVDHERRRSRDRDDDYEKADVKHGRDHRHGDREKKYDDDDDMDEEDNHGWAEKYDHGSKHHHAEDGEEQVHGRHYDYYQGYEDDDDHRYKGSDRHCDDDDEYDPVDEDKYGGGYDRGASKPKEERDSHRSRSREYEY